MARVSPLVLDFLGKHPADCARILEELPVQTTCSLMLSVRPSFAAPLLERMVTSYGSDCLSALDKEKAAALVREMKPPQAARLLRAMDAEAAKSILHLLPSHVRTNINGALRYPERTVGRIMNSNPFCLPEFITISDAVKRVKNQPDQTMHEIFVVDDEHKLKGVIHAASLLSSARSSPLQTLITRDVPYLSARAILESAARHEGWQKYGSLPVVGQDHTLAGILTSNTLMRELAEAWSVRESPAMANEIFSMTKMYWLAMAHIINTVAGDIRERRSEGQ